MHPIIKDYYDKGLINKEAVSRLEDLDNMTKEAGFSETLQSVWKNIRSTGMDVIKSTLGPAIGMGAGAYVTHSLNQKAQEGYQQQQNQMMSDSFEKMFSLVPQLRKHDKDKVKERFNEIARISPTVAKTPTVMAKVVKRTLRSGLNEKDVHGLYQLESNASNVNASRVSAVHPLSGPLSDVVSPMVTQIAEHGMLLSGLTPESYEGGPLDVKDFSAPTRDFEELTTANFSRLESTNPPHEELARMLTGNPVAMAERLRAAIAAGKDIPPHIRSMTFNNPKDREAFSEWASSPAARPVFKDFIAHGVFADRRAEAAAKAKEAEVGQEKKGHVLADMHVLIKQASLEKSAFKVPPGFWNGLLAASAIGIGTGAATAVADSISARNRKKEILASWDQTQKNLQRMTNEGSQLSLGTDYNDKKVQEAAKNVFNTLVTVAPDLASNAEIATTYVNRVVPSGEVDVQAIKTVSEIQKNMDNVSGYKSPFSKNPLIQGFSTGFNTAGGEKMVGEIAKNLKDS